MKYIILLLICIVTTSPLHGQSIPIDKMIHTSGCYFISTATYSLTYKLTQDRRKATIYGFTAAVAVGIAKELYDINHGNPEWGDLAADVTGAAIGVTVLRINF